jgi:uncharacterized protein YfaS (alpha-2-macroglobulin family)
MWLYAGTQSPEERRAIANKAFQAGNFRDAYDSLKKLTLDPKCDKFLVGKDLETAITCLQRLGRSDEIDDYRESVIALHIQNWRLLESAARSYANIEHYGFIVAGNFHRGSHRGGGRYVGSMERDRTRALQLMELALDLTGKETDKGALADFYMYFAQLLLNGAGSHEPWRLQYLTDLTKLPDYQEGGVYYGRRGGFGRGFGGGFVAGNNRGAPVDADGNPVFYHVPKGYREAPDDGERWRWMLTQAVEFKPDLANQADMIFGTFLRQQFGEQNMAYFGGRRPQESKKGEKNTGTYALHTLKDTETIARLATGLRRMTMPDEFNWIKIYLRVAGRGRSDFGAQARDALASIHEDRRQYVKAADDWKTAILEYGPGPNNHRQHRLQQIVNNWGRFEPGKVQPAAASGKNAGPGAKVTVDFRFRNGNKVSFEAFEIDVPKLLADVKAYLKNAPNQIQWEQVNISDLGYRLVHLNQGQYLKGKTAAWEVKLKPLPNHVDDRITMTTPLSKPGAYLVTAQMANGNLSRIIVWVSDTVIVKKQLDQKAYYYVADAVSGQPVAKANLEFFGWKQIQVQPFQNNWKVVTTNFAEFTDKDGQAIVTDKQMPQDHQWLVIARTDKGGGEGDGRFAYLGFNHVWYSPMYDPDYNQTRVFSISDRPVYRPQQTVHFKLWVRHAKYDQEDTSSFANKPFKVRIFNPKGEKLLEKSYTADDYGGMADDYAVAKGATLGVYNIQVIDPTWNGNRERVLGGGSFRVEEYKKPEFEVQVEAPSEPVALGEKITATIKAKYYFGSPVTKAKVKYKVERSAYSSEWFPRGAWDWLYGRGYWWFAPNYAWYPGWAEWGCLRPAFWWLPRAFTPPELVLENEVPIGADGIVKIEIDTAVAKELHGDTDHKYAITAEVVDESRRTIVGTGDVLVSRKPFQVFAWVNRGHYNVGDTVAASFYAQTLDKKPVEGKGELSLVRITYDDKNEPVEKVVRTWNLDTNAQGKASQQFKASQAGQYRLSYKVTDAKQHTIEGGYLFVVRGEGFDGRDFRFNAIELITDKREYAPGDKVKVMINTNRNDGVVVLFLRPTNGVYLPPKIIRLQGKSTEEEIAVIKRDMPNFFIEAFTIANGGIHSEVKEVVVPPEKRVLNVKVQPSQKEYKPGEKATVKVQLTDFFGKPFVGSTVLSVYDRSVEYIAGGSNVPEIKEFFWKWRRNHYPRTESTLDRWFSNIFRQGEIGMANLGIFGEGVVDELAKRKNGGPANGLGGFGGGRGAAPAAPGAAPMAAERQLRADGRSADKESAGADRAGAFRRAESEQLREGLQQQQQPNLIQPTIRKNFADTAFWAASLTADQDGMAEVSFTMPENLTGWKIRIWAMGHGTKVGQGDAEVVTKKDLLVRLQAPRFFTQKDEVVLSANVHNYLKSMKDVKVMLELEGGVLSPLGDLGQTVSIASGSEKRVDWRVKVTAQGEAVVRVKALTDEDSDAMEMRFPSYVHGILKMESFTGVIRPDKERAHVNFSVPEERRINDSRLEIRYSPTLAGAMVDALPYMVEYPYGCTEQTLNRFLPTVITQRILLNMKLDLKEIEKRRTNLNSQEIGDDKERAKGWKRYKRNPVFDEAEVQAMVKEGLRALTSMQLSDGGWGWFSGWGEHSFPHTTAVVVHGLQIAQQNGVALVPGMLERGVSWLKNYQDEQIRLLKNAATKTIPWKEHADNLDAFVYMVLIDAKVADNEMREFLYRDRQHLAVYGKAMYGLTLHKQQQAEKLAMILKNCEQYLVQDEDNQTAYLQLPAGTPWWYWYGSEVESNAYYLKLLSATNAKDERASRLVKYLLNNRKHATYWNNTRDSAVCIEAMAEYLKASGEDAPNMTVEIWLDGKKHKEVHIDRQNLFNFDNKLVMVGDAVETGKHLIEFKRRGKGPVYFNAYVTNFTMEDFITKAGLEVRVNRKYYKLTRVDHKIKVAGSRSQALDQKVEKYERSELANLGTLKSGDLVEIELEIDSKNDYEYLIFEDPKAAGFEPMEVRSGYGPNDMGAYMELRDEKVCFFVRHLARGKHSLRYRVRAEIPGRFSALPTQAYAMYAPELKGNSDEIKLNIAD